MSENSQLDKIVYVPNKGELDYAVPFDFFNEEDIAVSYVDPNGCDRTLVHDIDYTVSGGEDVYGEPTPGTIHIVESLCLDGGCLVICLSPCIPTDFFSSKGSLSTKKVKKAFHKISLALRGMKSMSNRYIKLPKHCDSCDLKVCVCPEDMIVGQILTIGLDEKGNKCIEPKRPAESDSSGSLPAISVDDECNFASVAIDPSDGEPYWAVGPLTADKITGFEIQDAKNCDALIYNGTQFAPKQLNYFFDTKMNGALFQDHDCWFLADGRDISTLGWSPDRIALYQSLVNVANTNGANLDPNALPSWNGRSPIGAGPSTDPLNTAGYIVGQLYGAETTQLVESQMPKHYHAMIGPLFGNAAFPQGDQTNPGINYYGGTPDDPSREYGTFSTGGGSASGDRDRTDDIGTGPGDPHTNMGPTFGTNYFIWVPEV